MLNSENQHDLNFEFQCQMFLNLYHNIYILLLGVDLSTKLCQDLLLNWTHLSLFQNVPVKGYTNFFLSSGSYNFKINYLKIK